MIINDLDLSRPLGRPKTAHSIPVVYAYAELSGAVALQRLKAIARRHPQIIQFAGTVQHRQLTHRDSFDAHELPDPAAREQSLGIGALE
jgi:hypothetical protein